MFYSKVYCCLEIMVTLQIYFIFLKIDKIIKWGWEEILFIYWVIFVI